MKKRNLLLLLFVPVMLASCNKGTNSGPIPSGVVIPDIGERYEGLTPDMDGCSEISSSGVSSEGFLTEILSDRFLGEDKSYVCYFESSLADKSLRVVSTNEGHATIEQSESKKSKFTINTHSAGDTVLKIYNADDELVFRKIVRVRPVYSSKTILNCLYNAEYYRTLKDYEDYIGSWRCSFYEGDEGAECALKGSDDADTNVNLTASLSFKEYYSPTDCYIFDATVLTSNTKNTSLVYVCVTAQGDLAYLYYPTTNNEGVMEEHLLTFLYNNDISYIYES